MKYELLISRVILKGEYEFMERINNPPRVPKKDELVQINGSLFTIRDIINTYSMGKYCVHVIIDYLDSVP